MTRSACPLLLVLLLGALSFGAEEPQDDVDWNKERQFWSFQPPKPQNLPQIKNRRWPRQRLDHFILARLEKEGLAPSLEADNRTLLRRVTFDLTGLPPTPAEVEAFLKDRTANAYARVVERLLASTAFGEHLASFWLNTARYAEDQAHQVGDDTKNFYPNAYRYRDWLIEAFNSDLPYDQFVRLQLAADKTEPARKEDLAALGFIGLGPKYYNRDKLEVMADEWEDRVDTVSRSFLGLTVACARCHDHKFDPITTRDYYSMAGIFASTKMVNKTADGEGEEMPEKKKDATANKDKKQKAQPNPKLLHMVEDGDPKDLNVFIRGNVKRPGPLAPKGFLHILSEKQPTLFKHGSGRADLAESIATDRNPLTARVMVNRVWAQVFGRGLVSTPSNFGHSGEMPSHPELLDDLANRFVANGWSVKQLIREMVLSATYRQSSHRNPGLEARDPENHLLARMNRRRLTAEQWRDSILFVSGRLDPLGGKSTDLSDPENRRKTVYARISRLKLDDYLMLFDYPDANVHAEKRAVTTTATQKLFILNSPFMLKNAEALALRISESDKESQARQIQNVYQLLFNREPSRDELKLGSSFLKNHDRWPAYAQALLASNEMLFLD